MSEDRTGTFFHCRNCNEMVVCSVGDGHMLREIEGHDGEQDWLYCCDTCLDMENCSAFGSVRHWCTDMFGAFSGKPLITPETLDSAIAAVFLEMEK